MQWLNNSTDSNKLHLQDLLMSEYVWYEMPGPTINHTKSFPYLSLIGPQDLHNTAVSCQFHLDLVWNVMPKPVPPRPDLPCACACRIKKRLFGMFWWGIHWCNRNSFVWGWWQLEACQKLTWCSIVSRHHGTAVDGRKLLFCLNDFGYYHCLLWMVFGWSSCW